MAMLLAASGWVTSCEWAAPPVFVVTDTAQGADADPGDGVCEVTPGVGDCTLEAAVAEADVAGRAEIVLAAGSHRVPSFTITGDVVIRGSAPGARISSPTITVAPGARLRIDGVGTTDIPGARILVDGTLVADHLRLMNLEGHDSVIHVRPGGAAALQNTMVAMVFGAGAPAVRNEGVLALRHTSLWSDGTDGLRGAGATTAVASYLQDCDAPVTSLGYNAAAGTGCGLGGPGDLEGVTPTFSLVWANPHYDLPADSPLVDVIPLGAAGCGTAPLDDIIGAPRPVDGDGDGTVACDVGARERPPGP